MNSPSIARVPHVHAEAIKAWADGAAIQYRNISGSTWFDIGWDGPAWNLNWEYRVKPEKVYPVTLLDTEELYEVWRRPAVPVGALTNVANAALRHAIDADQVVPMAEVQEVARNLNKSMRVKREREVAEEVYMACRNLVATYSSGCAHHLAQGIDIDKIIAKVRP